MILKYFRRKFCETNDVYCSKHSKFMKTVYFIIAYQEKTPFFAEKWEKSAENSHHTIDPLFLRFRGIFSGHSLANCIPEKLIGSVGPPGRSNL
jgi:hypothetical protein